MIAAPALFASLAAGFYTVSQSHFADDASRWCQLESGSCSYRSPLREISAGIPAARALDFSRSGRLSKKDFLRFDCPNFRNVAGILEDESVNCLHRLRQFVSVVIETDRASGNDPRPSHVEITPNVFRGVIAVNESKTQLECWGNRDFSRVATKRYDVCGIVSRIPRVDLPLTATSQETRCVHAGSSAGVSWRVVLPRVKGVNDVNDLSPLACFDGKLNGSDAEICTDFQEVSR